MIDGRGELPFAKEPRAVGGSRQALVWSASKILGVASSIRGRPTRPSHRHHIVAGHARAELVETGADGGPGQARRALQKGDAPSPNASGSAPAHKRVRRSSMTGRRATNLVQTIASSSTMPPIADHRLILVSISFASVALLIDCAWERLNDLFLRGSSNGEYAATRRPQ